MSKELKLRLSLYTLITAISFSYLVLPQNASVSVPVFVALQFLLLWFIVPDRKKLVLFIPIFIMSLNSFISASHIWRIPNFLISLILFTCMFTDIRFTNNNTGIVGNIIEKLFGSFAHFPLPFKWTLEINSKKAPVIKRVCLALVITIPCVLILTALLSIADMVFSATAGDLISTIFEGIKINTLIKIIWGIVAGLFLFGIVYNSYIDNDEEHIEEVSRKGDLLIINIILSAVLAVYTIFVVIQFKYLFAGSQLPYGLTYTEYARKGFFELLALTCINIAVILIVIKLTKHIETKWAVFTRVLCHYLCAVTIVLLVSSFYRMSLYINSYGLTRLRLFVIGFLIFEAIGLLITFIYIAKPKFSIILVYMTIALVYYSLLNLVPTDTIIAKNQIDNYLEKYDGIDYVFTLSADAATAMEPLLKGEKGSEVKARAEEFITDKTTFYIPDRWQRKNIAIENAKDMLK